MTRHFSQSELDLFIARVRSGDGVESAALALNTTGRTMYRRANQMSDFRAALDEAIRLREAARERRGRGHATTYNQGCRCADCTRASTERHREYVRRIQAQPIPATVQHGKHSTVAEARSSLDEAAAS